MATDGTPEHLLIVFKSWLNEAANDARIPYGPERNAFCDRLVSVFIEELYATTFRADRAERRAGNEAFVPTNLSSADARH